MFKITITKVETKPVAKRGDYTIVARVPWTEKELADAMSSHYGDKKDFLAKNPLREVRDYAPDWQGIENSEVKVLEQTVETLDLAAVIKAVNGL